MNHETYEIVISRATAEASRDQILTLAAQIQQWAERQPGFLERTLVEAGDGTWVDVIRWQNEADARRAAENVPQELMAQMAPLLDMSAVQMIHGQAVALGAASREATRT